MTQQHKPIWYILALLVVGSLVVLVSHLIKTDVAADNASPSPIPKISHTE